MKTLPLFQIDAFARRPLGGNPAAVCVLDEWPADALLQAIAAENNLSETAFFVARGDRFALRWFTPVTEVDLCGHATLAAAWLILTRLQPARSRVLFDTRSGTLTVEDRDESLRMHLPALDTDPCAIPEALPEGLGCNPREVRAGMDYLVVLDSERQIRALAPDFRVLAKLDRRGVIVTAPGDEVDFVSRFFAPLVGIDEDPVTGSAHCALAPYWAARLGTGTLTARQLSRRGGELHCEVRDRRVTLQGQCALYLEGKIHLP